MWWAFTVLLGSSVASSQAPPEGETEASDELTEPPAASDGEVLGVDPDRVPEPPADREVSAPPSEEDVRRGVTREFEVEGRPPPDDETWLDGPPRWFLAGAVDFGVLYFRPRFSGGFGTPYRSWIGFDVNPIFGGEGVGAYGGLRFAVPFVDLRVGARYFFTFRRSFLEPRDSYDHLQIESRAGPSSRYLSLESELSIDIPIGPTAIVGEFAITAVQFVDEGFYVFEETISVVVDPPFVLRGRLGYAVEFGPDEMIQIGLVGEIVRLPGRDVWIARAGIIARINLWDDVQLRGTVIPPVASPDTLGAGGGDSFLLGVRFRWATL
ncbi:MAG: hypothetical protein AAGF12_17305 [Myxococcota bacterium]